MGEMAPGFQFAPEDVDPYYFTAKTDDHGLGYVGLQSSGVLEQKNYGKKSSTLKTNNKAKGITGQVYGVRFCSNFTSFLVYLGIWCWRV